jgi:hypothetical protein
MPRFFNKALGPGCLPSISWTISQPVVICFRGRPHRFGLAWSIHAPPTSAAVPRSSRAWSRSRGRSRHIEIDSHESPHPSANHSSTQRCQCKPSPPTTIHGSLDPRSVGNVTSSASAREFVARSGAEACTQQVSRQRSRVRSSSVIGANGLAGCMLCEYDGCGITTMGSSATGAVD